MIMEDRPSLNSFTDILNEESEEIDDSQPMSLKTTSPNEESINFDITINRPAKNTGQYGEFRSVEEIDPKYRNVFTYPYFNLIQSRVIEDVLYSDKSIVVCAPTGSGKTVIFEMAIVKLLMDLEEQGYNDDFKIIYMAPVKAICTERLTEWYPKFTQLGCFCIEVTGDTDVDFTQLKHYRIIITTPEKWDILTRRWTDHRGLVEAIKLFLIDEVHILNDVTRGPVLEAVVSRMRTIEASAQSAFRIETLQRKIKNNENLHGNDITPPRIRFVAVSATVGNPEDVAAWLSTPDKSATYHKFGDECRPVRIRRVVEGYPCSEGTSIFKFDIILNYKLWPIIQKYYNGKPTLIFCNTRKSVALTAETLSREITITFNPEQKAKLTALASTIKNKKLHSLVLSGVGCHHAGLLFEERVNIENAFRHRDLPILITTTTLAMGVNLPAHLVIIKNTQQYINGAYQEYSISTVLQMVGRAGRPQFDAEATAVIMTRLQDKPRYQALVGGSEPLQSYLHRRLAENLNSEAALRTVTDVAQCVQWLRSTFLFVRAGRDPRRYLALPQNAPPQLISKKIEELCVKAMNGLATSGLITMDEASCIESTDAGRLMSIYYLDFETMKLIMKIDGTESLERLLWIVCESHELMEMHLRVDERSCLNALNRNKTAVTIRFPMKGKISTRQMKLNCIIQAILGCLQIPDPSLNQESTKIMRIVDRVCKCMVSYLTRIDLVSQQPSYFTAVLNAITLGKCIRAQLWENSPFVSRQLKGIGPAFSNLLATAGKNKFSLIEESHPRDLERIMNKGPPAGNILRKQVSLLPNYQLTITPVDQKTVSIKVVLLNLAYLSENSDQLTAGEHHRSYVIVGDTENSLILLTSFSDKDLINVFDGCITYLVDRKYNTEYKITAYCVSSTFVGIDAQTEYTLESLEPVQWVGNTVDESLEKIFKDVAPINNSPETTKTKKQTTITDVFKERKRKAGCDTDIVKSKEKRKRDCALIEKFNILKESFCANSSQIKSELEKSTIQTNNALKDITGTEDSLLYENDNSIMGENKLQNNLNTKYIQNLLPTTDDMGFDTSFDVSNFPDNENFVKTLDNYNTSDCPDNDRVDNIINTIENEISLMNKGNIIENTTSDQKYYVVTNWQNAQITPDGFELEQRNNSCNTQSTKVINTEPTKNKLKLNTKRIRKGNNYDFLRLLEKNVDYSDDEEPKSDSCNGFTEAIKFQVNNFLENAKHCNNSKSKHDNLLDNNIETKNNSNDYNNVNMIQNDTDITKKLKTGIINLENYNIYNIESITTKQTNDEVVKILPNETNSTQKSNHDKIIEPYHSPHNDYNTTKYNNNNIVVEILPRAINVSQKCNNNITSDGQRLYTDPKKNNNDCLMNSYEVTEILPSVTQTSNNIITAYGQSSELRTKCTNDIKVVEFLPMETNDTQTPKELIVNVFNQNIYDESNTRESFVDISFDKEFPSVDTKNNTHINIVKRINSITNMNVVQTNTDVLKDDKVKDKLVIMNKSDHVPKNVKVELTDKTHLTLALEGISGENLKNVYKKQNKINEDQSSNTSEVLKRQVNFCYSKAASVNENLRLVKVSKEVQESKTFGFCKSNNLKSTTSLVTIHNALNSTLTSSSATETKTGKVRITQKITLDVEMTATLEKRKNCNKNHKIDLYNQVKSQGDNDNGYTKAYCNPLMLKSNIGLSDQPKINDKTAINSININFSNKKHFPKEINNINSNTLGKESMSIETSNDQIIPVKNILHKYSKILQKEDINVTKYDSNKSTFDRDNNVKRNIVKPKRLFKIQDINKIDVDLPDSLIPITHPDAMAPSLELLLADKQKENRTIETNISLEEEINDIPELEFQEESELYTNDTDAEINIDQSMLNPKAVLEGFLTNEQSDKPIPANNSNISSEKEYNDPNDLRDNIDFEESANSGVTTPELGDLSMDKDLFYCDYYKTVDEKIVFQNTLKDGPSIASIDMSTSQEIETWTLSPNETAHEVYENTNPAKSLTIMRRNFSTYPRTGNFSRTEEKLNKFKFKRKLSYRTCM